MSGRMSTQLKRELNLAQQSGLARAAAEACREGLWLEFGDRAELTQLNPGGMAMTYFYARIGGLRCMVRVEPVTAEVYDRARSALGSWERRP
jgi:hypothetical protein